jgi:GntR family transcriptional repressor for pyruvate dehydrogenase complex
MPQNDSIEIGFGSLRVRRQRLSEQVAGQIQELIVTGGLKPGDKIPPERELAEQLGVSRTVIRETIKALQERGLVKVLTGSGSFVSRVEPETVSQSIGLFVSGYRGAFRSLFEVRNMLEVEIVRLAAERASEEHVEQLHSSLSKMRNALSRGGHTTDWLEDFVQADLSFHRVLAQATNNSLLPLLLAPITDLLLELCRKASSIPGAPETAIVYHQNILECVRSGDSQTSQELMREHLSKAREFAQIMEQDANSAALSGMR